MRRFGFTVAAGIFAALLAGQAYAAAPVCTGTTINLGTGVGLVGTVAELTGGNCLNVGDKTFGSVTITGAIAGTGGVHFTAPTLQGDVTVAFDGTVSGSNGVGSNGTINYSVAVNPALAGKFLIDDLEKDFTLNSNPAGTSAQATLVGIADAVNFTCVRNVNPDSSTCPVTHIFPTLLTNVTVSETLTANTATAVATALTDTISQAVPAVPEPTSLGLLGTGLLGLGLLARRRRS